MFHSLLNRQLRRQGLSNDKAPAPAEWEQFLERISRAYADADHERYLLERSLTISSQEMQDLYSQLRKSETRYALAARGANDGLWDWDLVTGEVYFSARWKEILGDETEEKVHTVGEWLDRIHPDDRGMVEAELTAHLEGNTRHFENEHRVRHGAGDFRWVLCRGLAVRGETGEALRMAGSLTDISGRKKTERKLQHDAVHDSLTGLPNRKMLMERLTRSLERTRRNSEYQFAILFLDLDRFKIVNDSLGHQAGDQLLLHITRKLGVILRPGDMVARLGGDEFVLLVDHLKEREQATTVAERIQKELSTPFKLNGNDLFSSASIGIAYSSPAYERAEYLIRDADIAMYRAKARGKARFALFDQEMHQRAVTLLHLENDLRHACQRQEFVIHYQPIITLDSGAILGFEALTRWIHPERGLVSPAEFIPLAEETGLINEIGAWVLHESCRQMVQWQQEIPQARDMLISVNLSVRQLEKPDLVEMVAGALVKTGLAASCLKLEITESAIMRNPEQAVARVRELRAMGVQVSIDDFGTGYSSLSYLHRFPINTLKIDRSFINRVSDQDEATEIIQTIILLAHKLNIEVIAEGVETIEQLNFLRHINCGYAQGFYYSRPVESGQAGQLITSFAAEQANSAAP
ncbi:MAG: putative bifunctional diguanylate cyclase/phosphodiesterase [Blastocatellia bacterium]